MNEIISVALANPNRKQQRFTSTPLEAWMFLPISEEELQKAMASIGSADEFADYYISEVETCGYEIALHCGDTIEELNEVAKRIAALQKADYLEAMKLSAYLEAHPDLTLAEINALLNKGFENYDLLVGLTSFQEFREFCYTQGNGYEHLQWELVFYLESDGRIKHSCEIYHTSVGTLMRAS